LSVGAEAADSGGQLLYRVKAAAFMGGNLAILNAGTAELLIYGEGGRLLRKLGGQGSGPGEMQEPSGLITRGGTFLVWDAARGQILAYDTLGRTDSGSAVDLSRFAEVHPMALQMMPEFRWALVSPTTMLVFGYEQLDTSEEGVFRPPVAFVLSDLGVTQSDTLGRYPGTEQARLRGGRVVRVLQGRNTLFAVSPRSGRVFIGDNQRMAVDRYGPSGTMEMSVRVGWAPRAPFADAIASERSALEAQYRGWGVPDPESWARLAPVAESAPAFRSLFVDAEENLWIEASDDDAAHNECMVFDSVGVYVGSVVLPEEGRILAVSDDRLAVLRLDQNDVETVDVYRLHRR
jgi:hypothetical protein